MHNADPLVTYQLASPIGEVGGSFHLTVNRAQEETASPGHNGRVRELRVQLEYRTEGRGDTDEHHFHAASVPMDALGGGQADIELEIPSSAPISYDGQLVRIRYRITIITDRQRSFDRRTEIDVVVVPEGGAQTYRRPHPLRTSRG